MSVTGYSGGEPLKVGISLGDYMGGYNGAIAILAALLLPDRIGRGAGHRHLHAGRYLGDGFP